VVTVAKVGRVRSSDETVAKTPYKMGLPSLSLGGLILRGLEPSLEDEQKEEIGLETEDLGERGSS